MKHFQVHLLHPTMLRLIFSILTMTGIWAPGLQAQQDQSQNQPLPKGFKNGKVVLENNTILSGYIREHFRSHASVIFISDKGGKGRELDGQQLRSLTIDSTTYRCLKGDFFKVITEGEIAFLQKCSDASGKPVYNGTDPLLINGTEGRPGDYFVYNNGLGQLTWVTRKTLGKVVRETFGNCTAAIDKAGTVHSDIVDLRDAIELYNNRSK